jgi:hypothetical protein
LDSASALDIEDESETESNTFSANSFSKEDASIDAANILGLQLSNAIVSTVTDGKA